MHRGIRIVSVAFASRALRISLRPSALDAAKLDPIDTTIPTSSALGRINGRPRPKCFNQPLTFKRKVESKCQSNHTVDRLNPQPAVRSGRITAG